MKNQKILNMLLVIFMLSGLFGCTMFRQRDYKKKVAVLAVLPFENFSNDVKGAEVARKEMFKALRKGGYEVMDQEKTDLLLRDAGVTDGGQLKAVDLSKLAEVLGTRTFVKGEVKIYFQGMSFEILPFGLFFKREVELKITVLDAVTEKILFEATRRDRDLKKVEDKNQGSFLENVAKSAVKNAIADTVYSGVEFMTEELAERIVYEMPYYYEPN